MEIYEGNSETVSVPAGEFSNCLKTKLVTSEEPEEGCIVEHAASLFLNSLYDQKLNKPAACSTDT